MWGRRPVERYKSQGKVWMIPVREIRQSACPTRREFPYDHLLALAQNIGENGILNPLTVTFEGDFPVLVAGHRRLRAAKIAGLREVPCLVLPADHKRAAALALAENMQRQPLTCFEQATALRGMMQRFRLTEEETARTLGCTPEVVKEALRLLALSPREQATLVEHGCGLPHARALLREQDADRREALLQKMISQKANPVAQGEPPEPKKKAVRRAVPVVRDMRLFFNTLNHAVDIMRRSGIDAQISQTECDGFMEMTVRVPCMTVRKPA